jgi:hypothetical protein
VAIHRSLEHLMTQSSYIVASMTRDGNTFDWQAFVAFIVLIVIVIHFFVR